MCIRFTPVASVDGNDGLLLNVTGCAHLWGGEEEYITDMHKRFSDLGYDIRIAIAGTVGAAWAVARFGNGITRVTNGDEVNALMSLPAQCLRIEDALAERLKKLGLAEVRSFINMPRPSLRRRFGPELLGRIDQALGQEEEWIFPVIAPEPFHERLPCLEPVITAKGIEIALERLLDNLCCRLKKESKGLRTAIFKAYRVDGKTEQLTIGTTRPSCNALHLFKLFEIKISSIEPAMGIELFTLDAPFVEELHISQEQLWETTEALDDNELSELLDRIGGKLGAQCIHRYVADEHYWPERSFRPAVSLGEKSNVPWKNDVPRPLRLLQSPQPIEVTAPIPDYPPMMFRHKGKLHKIVKADGPERIEQEWWLQQGPHRDYYSVEDEEGKRYWLFRSGHYDPSRTYRWFLHGFFA